MAGIGAEEVTCLSLRSGGNDWKMFSCFNPDGKPD